MKQRLSPILLIILLSLLLLGGLIITFWQFNIYCTWLSIDTLPVSISKPIEQTMGLLELNSDTVVNVTKIGTIANSLDLGDVVEMMQSPGNDDLLVIYASGIFQRWDLNTFQLKSGFDFLAADSRGVSFSADGSRVITPGSVSHTLELNGYTIWDTQSGEIIDCIGHHCPGGWAQINSYQTGIGLTPNNKWIIGYLASFLHANGVSLRMAGTWDIDDDPYDTSDITINNIAFDSSGYYLACATEENQVYVFDVDELFNPAGIDNEDILTGSGRPAVTSFPPIRSRQYGNYDPDAKTITNDLAFDDTRSWLAQLTEDNLVIWDLRKTIFPRWMQIPVKDASVLAFNHAGNLLAVGTDREILFFDLESRSQVVSISVGEVTELYFSRDDRLLVWGDADGTIHLWGVVQFP